MYYLKFLNLKYINNFFGFSYRIVHAQKSQENFYLFKELFAFFLSQYKENHFFQKSTVS